MSEAKCSRPAPTPASKKSFAKQNTLPSPAPIPMDQPDPINIPAYQRKRSIAAKARKKPAYLETALDRAVKAKKEHKRQRANRTKKSPASSRNQSVDTYIQSPNSFEEISIQTTSVLPSHELFPDPFHDNHSSRKSEFREMKTCGICEGYYDKIQVAIVRVTSPLRVGDSIIFEKQDGLFEQEIKSMQIDRRDITLATTGSEIGLKVLQKPTVGSPVYKVLE